MDEFDKKYLSFVDKKFGAPQDKPLYHYTSLDALVNGLIRQTNENESVVCFRATHCNYLNDPMELAIGQFFTSDFLARMFPQKTKKEWFQDLRQRYNDIYSISFSLKKDSLPMWNMYAKQCT